MSTLDDIAPFSPHSLSLSPFLPPANPSRAALHDVKAMRDKLERRAAERPGLLPPMRRGVATRYAGGKRDESTTTLDDVGWLRGKRASVSHIDEFDAFEESIAFPLVSGAARTRELNRISDPAAAERLIAQATRKAAQAARATAAERSAVADRHEDGTIVDAWERASMADSDEDDEDTLPEPVYRASEMPLPDRRSPWPAIVMAAVIVLATGAAWHHSSALLTAVDAVVLSAPQLLPR
jgi:hypothetical protein